MTPVLKVVKVTRETRGKKVRLGLKVQLVLRGLKVHRVVKVLKVQLV